MKDVEWIQSVAPRAPVLGVPTGSQGGRSQDSVS